MSTLLSWDSSWKELDLAMNLAYSGGEDFVLLNPPTEGSAYEVHANGDSNTIYAGSNNVIDADGGADQLHSLDGKDNILFGGNGPDIFTLNAPGDTVYGGFYRPSGEIRAADGFRNRFEIFLDGVKEEGSSLTIKDLQLDLDELFVDFGDETKNRSGSVSLADYAELKQILQGNDVILNAAPIRFSDTLPSASAFIGNPFSYQLPIGSFLDPDGEDLSYSASLLDYSPLPAWLSIDPVTGELNGSPSVGDSGVLTVLVKADDGVSLVSQAIELTVVRRPTFQVMNARHTASGLALKLSEAPDFERLNLYDGNDASTDLPDLHLTRSDGTDVGDLSLHWKAETSELYVIHTDSLTGITQNQFAAGASPFQSDLLAAGDYTLMIDARSDGLVSASSGELIDGNGDGITGDPFSYSFTKSTPSNLISVADTARGPGQSLGLNGIAKSNGINGLPVLISTAAAIRSLHGTLTYDATAFNNASLTVGRDLPDGWTLQIQEDVIGSLNYTASGTTAISGTDQELFRFNAVVSQDASYGASTLIEATVEAPEDPTLTFESDPSLVVLAYSGDTTGNGTLSSLDASRIQRVVVGLDTGFDAYDTFAPTLIGDITGNGGLSSLDASRVQQRVVGLPVTSFPSIPADPLA